MMSTLADDPVPLGDAATAWAVETDGMDLVEIGECAVAPGEITDLPDRGNIAIHRIHRLEGHNLG